MCGFVGVYRPTGCEVDSLVATINYMNRSLRHRGPDSDGYWTDKNGIIGLAHQRLSVEDLTEAGAQPMHSPSGRFVIAFNGEIYNHRAIRAELEAKRIAPDWIGTSDTETIAAAIDVWGIHETVLWCSGMFACVIWDRQTRKLSLMRDRMGEKPLYYGWCGNTFVFASELRAIERLQDINLTIDPVALDLFLRFSYVPGPLSIYSEIKKLPAGNFATVLPEPGTPPDCMEYWSLSECAISGLQTPFKGDAEDAHDELERLISKSVNRQMIADVPVGAFLSGGVDSAGVVSEMVRNTSSKVSTFTLGFGQVGYDETTRARQISERLGTLHHEKVVTENEAMQVVPDLGRLYDEPFADSSQIPTILISRFARKSVTVALTGDGGDEIFGGYPRHSSAALWQSRTCIYPFIIRNLIGSLLDHALKLVGKLHCKFIPALHDGVRKLTKVAEIIRAESLGEAYSEWITHWRSSDRILQKFIAKHKPSGGVFAINTPLNDFDRELMLIDSLTYLVDEILVKVDRAAMSTSLETRAPYLDHELVEFAWTLPKNFIMDGHKRKCLLRDFVSRRIAPLSLDTTKSGFSVPLGNWLRGGLRDWAEDMLASRSDAGIALNEVVIKRVWDEHKKARKDNSALLWSVLMYKSWVLERL